MPEYPRLLSTFHQYGDWLQRMGVDSVGALNDMIIEQRSPEEVLSLAGQPIAAVGAGAWNPAFDVTPADLVDAIVTERGVVLAPNADKMAAMMENA